MANNIVIPDEGKTLLLDWALKGGSHENYVLDAYVNNVVPDDSSTASGFTIASFSGYLQIAINASSWGSSTIVSHQAQSVNTGDPFSFTRTVTGSSQTIYGWILRGATSGKILAAAALTTPRVMASAGDTTSVSLPLNLATLP